MSDLERLTVLIVRPRNDLAQDLIDASAVASGAGMPDREYDQLMERLPETALLKDARLRLRAQIRAELDPGR